MHYNKLGEMVESKVYHWGNTSIMASLKRCKVKFSDLHKTLQIYVPNGRYKGGMTPEEIKEFENLFELSLEYGRCVRLTSSHNVFIIEKNKIQGFQPEGLDNPNYLISTTEENLQLILSSDDKIKELEKFYSEGKITIKGQSLGAKIKLSLGSFVYNFFN
jgi:hypothetical protein